MQYIGADLFSAFAILAFKAEFYFVPRIGAFPVDLDKIHALRYFLNLYRRYGNPF
ncbi:Hypothetical protein BCETI_3000338 [Brucella ceti str. Cudo]|uniref:Uncharacterized protein n=1 Tax=Brucella ceti str. Cudo TaxID=595497 RepID=C0G6E8_9HYPH|nr:Hypothetical protein BCETI_3000338 [Brucella ceti str. Cudo]